MAAVQPQALTVVPAQALGAPLMPLLPALSLDGLRCACPAACCSGRSQPHCSTHRGPC